MAISKSQERRASLALSGTGRSDKINSSPGLDAAYFHSDWTWKDRCVAWVENYTATRQDAFVAANAAAIREVLRNKELSPRMVVNIGADALAKFLKDGSYKNAYERPVLMGREVGPSRTRHRVDTLLGFHKGAAKKIYFGAVALGGTGVRFYGEYCMALRPSKKDNIILRLLDRNSYDLIKPPLARRARNSSFVNRLRGRWSKDLANILILKVMPKLEVGNRLVTSGTVAEAVLQDEDFIEVHRTGTFGPADLEEVREAPQDAALEGDIVAKHDRGHLPTGAEFLFVARRWRAQELMSEHQVRPRMVVSAGRTARWG